MFTIRLNPVDLNRLKRRMALTAHAMDVAGMHMAQQVEDRFETHGASGGVPWPVKRSAEWGHNDGRGILTGASGMLRKSFAGYAINAGEAVCASNCQYAEIHQVGTVGKGGLKPTIRPKNGGKALFIPITDKARNSTRMSGEKADSWGALTGARPFGKASGKPMRFGVTYHKTEFGNWAERYDGLVKGRLKDNKLERWNARKGAYETGTPDFIFLGKVDIAPRPMLPDSPAEVNEVLKVLTEAMLLMRKSPRLYGSGVL